MKKSLYEIVIFLIAVILVISGFALAIMKYKSSPASNTLLNQSALPVESVLPSDWVKGDKDAKIVLIEYGDFQCPPCGYYSPIVNKVAYDFSDKIVFVYRHFPLKSIHQNAELAALASEAAGKQGKFWEMHDLIYENQKEWSEKPNAETFFLKYAQSLNLDINQFKKDIASKELKEKVIADFNSGTKSGVNGTPTFFLNGKKTPYPKDYDEFKKLVQDAISNL